MFLHKGRQILQFLCFCFTVFYSNLKYNSFHYFSEIAAPNERTKQSSRGFLSKELFCSFVNELFAQYTSFIELDLKIDLEPLVRLSVFALNKNYRLNALSKATSANERLENSGAGILALLLRFYSLSILAYSDQLGFHYLGGLRHLLFP